jgi:ABC-type microcin C transport system permease subunit YejB
MRTPWSAVTIIAAYAEPGWVLALMMIPALAHGTRPGFVAVPGPFPAGIRPVSEVTRTVTLPLPASGWRTK